MTSFFLALLMFLSFVLNIYMLKDGHNWGDDFAQYIINGFNFIQLKPYMSGVMLDQSLISFPGFSLMLAPFLKIWGLNFLILKCLMVVFWYVAVLAIYKILRDMTNKDYAFLIAALLSLSSFFFIFKQNILSDVPFFCLVCIALYLFEKHKCWNLFLVIVSLAFWTRPVGCLLFFAGAIALIQRKSWGRAFAVLALFLINCVAILMVMGVSKDYASLIHFNPASIFYDVKHGAEVLFCALFMLILPAQTDLSLMIVIGFIKIIKILSVFILAGIVLNVLLNILARRLTFLECFACLYLVVFIYFASHSQTPPDAFARFMLPLLPIVFIQMYSVYKLSIWGRLRFNLCFILIWICLIVNVYNIYFNRNFNDSVLTRGNVEMIEWVKNNVSIDEHFMFRRPRFLALMTGRVGAAPLASSQQRGNFDERIATLGIKYIILFKETSVYLLNQLKDDAHFEVVWENSTFKVFKVI